MTFGNELQHACENIKGADKVFGNISQHKPRYHFTVVSNLVYLLIYKYTVLYFNIATF